MTPAPTVRLPDPAGAVAPVQGLAPDMLQGLALLLAVGLLLWMTVSIARATSLTAAALQLWIAGLVGAVALAVAGAGDAAMVWGAMGATVLTLVVLGLLAHTKRDPVVVRRPSAWIALVVVATGLAMLWLVPALPPTGTQAPAPASRGEPFIAAILAGLLLCAKLGVRAALGWGERALSRRRGGGGTP